MNKNADIKQQHKQLKRKPKLDNAKAHKPPMTAPAQLQADVQLLQRTLGNQGMGQALSGKQIQQDKVSPLDVQGILHRPITRTQSNAIVQKQDIPSIQRAGIKEGKDKIKLRDSKSKIIETIQVSQIKNVQVNQNDPQTIHKTVGKLNPVKQDVTAFHVTITTKDGKAHAGLLARRQLTGLEEKLPSLNQTEEEDVPTPEEMVANLPSEGGAETAGGTKRSAAQSEYMNQLRKNVSGESQGESETDMPPARTARAGFPDYAPPKPPPNALSVDFPPARTASESAPAAQGAPKQSAQSQLADSGVLISRPARPKPQSASTPQATPATTPASTPPAVAPVPESQFDKQARQSRVGEVEQILNTLQGQDVLTNRQNKYQNYMTKLGVYLQELRVGKVKQATVQYLYQHEAEARLSIAETTGPFKKAAPEKMAGEMLKLMAIIDYDRQKTEAKQGAEAKADGELKEEDFTKLQQLQASFAQHRAEIDVIDGQIEEALQKKRELKELKKGLPSSKITTSNLTQVKLRIVELQRRRENKIKEVLIPTPELVSDMKFINNIPQLGFVFNIFLSREMGETKRSIERLRRSLNQHAEGNQVLDKLLASMSGEAESEQNKADAKVVIDMVLKLATPVINYGAEVAKNATSSTIGNVISSSIQAGLFLGKRKAAASLPNEGDTVLQGLSEVEIYNLANQQFHSQAVAINDEMLVEYFVLKHSDVKVNLGGRDISYILKLANMLRGTEQLDGEGEFKNLKQVIGKIRQKYDKQTVTSILGEFTKDFNAFHAKQTKQELRAAQ